MENQVLSSLKEKEKQLYEELKDTTAYKKWQAIKMAVNVFEGKENDNDSIDISTAHETHKIEYDQTFTWQEKVNYALNNITSGFISDIVNELKKFDEEKDEEVLHRRIGATVSFMLDKKILQVIHKSGRRIKVAKK